MIGDAIVAAIRTRLTAELAPPATPLRPLRIDGRAVGWLDPARFARATAFTDVFRAEEDGIAFVPGLGDLATRTRALETVTKALAAEGALSAWRDERYAVTPEFGATPWFLLERAAARYFGVRTFAAHVNGLVRDGVISMWLARRSATKAIDPGLLDNLVGGGIAAGTTVAATVVKEAWEEAGIGPEVAAQAVPMRTVDICRVQPHGLQRETIYVHDLWLPIGFEPAPRDDEVACNRRVDLAAAARLIANTHGDDIVTGDASLVVLDCLLRLGAIERASPHYAALDALRRTDDAWG